MRITYIGHATVLVELAHRRFLTDPNFDPALGRFLRRVAAPGIALGELPPLDAVLLTHAHADHLSFHSLDAIPRSVPIYAPPPISRWLRRRGYKNALPLAPGAFEEVGGIRVHAGAAAHEGMRYGYDRWRRAANMYLLDTGVHSLFFAGDTGLREDTHRLVHDTLGERRPDVALLPIGHAPWWKPRFRRGHLSSDDALTLFERLGARFLIPYHWGTFHHVTAGPYDAITRLRALLPAHQRGPDVRIIEPGTIFELEPIPT